MCYVRVGMDSFPITVAAPGTEMIEKFTLPGGQQGAPLRAWGLPWGGGVQERVMGTTGSRVAMNMGEGDFPRGAVTHTTQHS